LGMHNLFCFMFWTCGIVYTIRSSSSKRCSESAGAAAAEPRTW
jgi:hypothetical protein